MKEILPETVLNTIPTGWRTIRLKYLGRFAASGIDKKTVKGEVPVSMVNYTDVYNNNDRVLANSKNYMHTTCSAKKKAEFNLLEGDLLFTPSSETIEEIGYSALVIEDLVNTVFSYHLVRLRFVESLHVNFRKYLCHNHVVLGQFARSSKGSTRKILGRDGFNNAIVPVPPVQTQELISSYLDRATAQIDKLLEEKNRVLSLLEEKRATQINHVVTHGLNPDAPLKQSGHSWLGEIPAHWDVRRAKSLFKEIDRRTETGEEELLSLRMNFGLVPHKEVSDKLILPKEIVGFKKVEVGQLVINRMRAAIGLIAIAPQSGLVSPDYAVFDHFREVNANYFVHLFKTELLQAVFRSASKGLGTGSSGFLRLYSDSFLSLHFPLPPLTEQIEIVDYIKNEWRRTSELESELKKSIILLKERRSALITAAVTGQLKPKDMQI